MQVLVPLHLQQEIERELRLIIRNIETLPLDGWKPPPANQAEVLLRFFPNDAYPGRVFDATMLRRVIQVSPNLKWIHNGMTGMDAVLYPELVSSEIILTNSAGAHRVSIAESVLGLMLAWAKQLKKHLEHQQLRRWQHVSHTSLRGKTVLIVGLGNIGREIARLCRCFDMNVIGVKRTVENSPDHTLIIPTKEIQSKLPEADYVIISAALTAETYHLIGVPELKLMKPDTFLVNIARGGIVDEDALLVGLQNRWIGGAAMDVFSKEPLPQSSPFWSMENVTITPHNSAWSELVQEEALSIFIENFKRYTEGKPLINLVDKQLGY